MCAEVIVKYRLLIVCKLSLIIALLPYIGLFHPFRDQDISRCERQRLLETIPSFYDFPQFAACTAPASFFSPRHLF